jgi:hypothetical protein
MSGAFSDERTGLSFIIVALTGPAYNISAQTAWKTPFLCYSAVVEFMSIGMTT